MPKQTAEIDIRLSNGAEAGKTINELTSQSVKLAREIKKMEIGSKEYVTATDDYKKVAGRLKDVKSETFNTAKAQDMLNSQMGQYIPFNSQLGGMITTFKGLGAAIKGATISQRALNIAIAASGIGLIIIALVKLVQAFLSTQAGMDKVTAVTRPLIAIFDRLKGLVQELGGSVFKGLGQILKGDIAEGLKTLGSGITDAVKGVGGAIKEGAKAGAEIDKLQKQIEKTQNAMILSQSRLNREIAQQSELARDSSKSEKERQAAAQKAIDLIAQRVAEEDNLLQLQIKKMEIEQSLNDTDREGNAEMNQLIAQREDIIATASRERIRLNKIAHGTEKSGEKDVTKNLEKEEADRLKLKADAAKVEEDLKKKLIDAENTLKELRIGAMTDEQDKKIAQLLLGYERELAAFAGSEEQKKEFTLLKKGELDAAITAVEDEFAKKAAEKAMVDLDKANEIKEAKIWEQFYSNQITEEERKNILFEQEKSAIETRLALLATAGSIETAEYQKLYTNLAKLNYEHELEKTKAVEENEAARKALRNEGLAAAAGVFAGLATLLAQSSKDRKKNFAVIKAVQAAEVAANTTLEISNIWTAVSKIPEPLATILRVVQTALAVGRGIGALNKINSIQVGGGGGESYADGGVVRGPSHKDGGIPFGVKGSRIRHEMEGNEIIMTRGVFQNPVLRAMASDINVMGGGRSFALGGPVMQDRGFINTSGSTSGVGAAGSAQAAAAMDFSELKALMKQVVINTGVTADKPVLALTQIKDGLMMLNEVENDAMF